MTYWQGKGIRLRAVQFQDLPLFEGFDDDDDKMVDVIQLPQSTEARMRWLEGQIKQRLGDSYRWIAENADGEPVGTIDTFACQRRHGTFKYGIIVSKAHRGKGYATEMIRLVLRYYFLELNYQKATPHVYSFNAPSIALHEKLGFVREGVLRRMIYTNGLYADEIHYGITREEYMAGLHE